MAMGLLVMSAFARWVSQETFGTYQYILAVFGTLLIFTLPGTNTSLVLSIAQKKDGTLRAALREKMKWALLGSLCALGLGAWYFLHGNILLGASFSLAALFLPLTNTFSIHNSFWSGRKLFKKKTLYEVSSVVGSSLLLLPVLFLSDNLILSW